MIRHLNIKICGQVQGVFFRQFVYAKAKELRVVGFVKNLPDGTVYVEAEGEEKNLKKFLNFCYQGSPLSKVENIDFEFSNELKNFDDFLIK